MKKTSARQKNDPTSVPTETLALVRGGSGARQVGTSPVRGGDDDDPNGPIIIIGRDGP